ncbi:protein serine/threonine phosphatase 2C [Polyporus arcularius HHB13444]|uniref:Protein serine/threonine phosphatase 2C n=1 Tax=Polyporus arcularius HHB13444 TaxID=1314778 RepID=A0A5C3PPQ2_9APHY|nr:protein serine/threonine phosphatase 2C [Polyporus arcularius HHB13444]
MACFLPSRSPSLLRSLPRLPQHRSARYHDYVRICTPAGGMGRFLLNNPNFIGAANSRGERRYQEDFYSYSALSLEPEEIRLTLKKAHDLDWDPSALPPSIARQVLFVGIYDGHGGSTVSQFLRQELHGLLENVHKSQVPEVYAWAKELGGYFRRFNGGALAPWIEPTAPTFQEEMDLEARATLAFFEVDKILSEEKEAKECGATSSVVLLKSLDNMGFFQATQLALTVAHVGDTRVLLTSTDAGRVTPLTENHHAEARVESQRLRRMMGGLTTDSFGEVRWMGALANTRCLGDLKFKPFGVTPEPEVRHMLLEGPKYSHLTLLSDGVSSVVSDEEVSDLARGALTPKVAADRILTFAEEMGSDDNMTAVIVPLAGWNKITGPDRTKELREYRLKGMQGSERHRGRWM